jgi:hypothetical protein
MLSGIGAADHLAGHGIAVVVDNQAALGRSPGHLRSA